MKIIPLHETSLLQIPEKTHLYSLDTFLQYTPKMAATVSGSPPNFFEIMGNSLPALIGEIPNPTRNVTLSFQQIRKALRDISLVYQTKLGRYDVRTNWKDPANRCAYVFLYFSKHSHLVYKALLVNRMFFDMSWLMRREIKVCSIGGGPGSDIAGVIAFLNRLNYEPTLQCSVLDLFPEWQLTWQDIKAQMPPSNVGRLDVQYRQFDMTKGPPFARDISNLLRNADLVTFVKSFSTVSVESSVHTIVLPSIMKALQPGAFILFIDNSVNQVANASFKIIAQKAGFNVLYQFDHNIKLTLPATGLVLGFSSGECFDYRPLRSCSVIIYLLQKPSASSPLMNSCLPY